MKWKSALLRAWIGAVIGYILAALIANVGVVMFTDVDDVDFIFAVSAVVLAPMGAVIGAVVGGLLGIFKATGGSAVQLGETQAPSTAITERSDTIKPGRNMLRVITVIMVGIAGAGAGIALWYLLWAGLLLLPGHIPWLRMENPSDPVIFSITVIMTVLVIIMPPISAGLGALAGAKLVLRYWPEPRTIPD